jgi:hypothetical protein
LIAAGACLAAMLVAGCGGGGGNEEVTESSTSKAQFIAKADAICEKSTTKMKAGLIAYSKRAGEEKTPLSQQYGTLVETIFVPNIEQEINGIRELGAPQGDLAQVKTLIEAREKSIVEAQENPKRVVGDREFFDSARTAAAKYGLKACAEF